MKRICVFCGSSPGGNPAYMQAARSLSEALVRRKIGLVFGGGKVGMMGELARTAFELGGEVIGVIPRDLVKKEVAFTGLADLRVVDSMHERKALMAELSDGFIALPGGFGTLEEFFEVVTWAQLGLHLKPCGLLDVADYYSRLGEFLDHAVAEQFILGGHREMILIERDPEALIERFEHYQAPVIDKAAWALRLNHE
jgi:uncharacterized protein (TIGR00730 family)